MLMRLSYVSTRVEAEQDLLQDISDILVEARNFNAQHHIYGVLYYAKGIFFQCLEGEQDEVNALFDRIRLDHRHTQVQRFQDQFIDQIMFKKWSMKYVHEHSEIAHLFKNFGLNEFNPYPLNPSQVEQLIQVLHQQKEDAEKSVVGYKSRGYQNYF